MLISDRSNCDGLHAASFSVPEQFSNCRALQLSKCDGRDIIHDSIRKHLRGFWKGTNTHSPRKWLIHGPQSTLNGHLTIRGWLCISVHLKLFDSSCPRASFIGTDSCQGLHFSPSCIVRESLHRETEDVVLCQLWSGLCLQLQCEGSCYKHSASARFSLLDPVSPAHMVILGTRDCSCSIYCLHCQQL